MQENVWEITSDCWYPDQFLCFVCGFATGCGMGPDGTISFSGCIIFP